MNIKKIIMSLIAILTIIILSQCVYSAGSSVTIVGENEAQIGESKQLTVKLSSSDTIGIISGKIYGNENVQILSVNGKNDWNLTYNSVTGVFNIYKAEGSMEEDIMVIQYKTVNENVTGKITIGNLKATSIDYETENLSNIEKNIEIKSPVEVQEEIIEDGVNEEEKNEEEKNEKDIEDNYDDLKLEDSSDVEPKQAISTNKMAVANKTLPKTGDFNIMIPIIILGLLLVSIVLYIKNKNYKDVK